MATEPEKVAPPTEAPVAEPEKAAPPPTARPTDYFEVADVVLRLLVFASALVSVVVMSTSKQTEIVPIPIPPYQAPRSAKFNHSPALIYFVAAHSVAGFFSIITTLGSLYSLIKPGCSAKIISHFIVIDVEDGIHLRPVCKITLEIKFGVLYSLAYLENHSGNEIWCNYTV
ncbi:CASP-like protein IN26 isoform X2 [Capsicum annuum]|uniref:CASP-like protein IN26 isoform X2 n=1 Tax=Capsicum annuum TaxID=4072 RepID=UPI001FB0B01F|nr:CASP-like protein IN26 isoform X2 [Capsicum annuum]